MTTTHAQSENDLVNVAEAARIAYLSPDTIRRYSDSGKLATLRTPANHRRFVRSDVLALLTPQAVPAAPAVEESSPEVTSPIAGASLHSGDAA
jgi:hypothetical protein